MQFTTQTAEFVDWPRLRKSIDLPLIKLAGLALAVLGLGHILGMSSWDLVEHTLPWYIRLILGVVVFFAASAWLRVHRFSERGATTAFAAALIGGHWVAIDLHHYLDHGLHVSPVVMVSLSLVGFAFCHLAYHRERHSWRKWATFGRSLASARVSKAGSEIEFLVLFVSPPTTVPFVSDGSFDFTLPPKNPPAPAQIDQDRITIDRTDIEKACGEMQPLHHNWQQMLRAVSPHTKNLKTLWLIGSPASPETAPGMAAAGKPAPFNHGSHVYLELAKQFLTPYLGETSIHLSDPVDFEDNKVLETYLREIVLPHHGKVPAQKIAIDVTGGIKTASCVACLITVNGEAVFQYVPAFTSDPGVQPQALVYDIRNDGGPSVPS